MKALNFNKNSWHYRLVNYFYNDWNISHNLCGYFWQVVFSLFVAILAIFGIAVFIYVLAIAPLMWFFVLFQFGYLPPHTEAIIGLILDTGIILTTIIYFISEKLSERREKKRIVSQQKPKQDSFIHASYRKFKDKTCMRIEFND